ncbi:MAG: ATP-grasp domain-containing protein, partial [Vicinamibacterales bacterium]
WTREAAFVDALAAAVRERRVDVGLPIADVASALVAEHRERLAPACVPLPSADALRRAADKADVLRTAQRLGLGTPRTIFLEDGEPLPATNGLSYPVVVKPRRSRVRGESGWVSCSVAYVDTPEALALLVSKMPRGAFPLALQERIHGAGMGVFLCRLGGRVIARFSHRRIREKPPTGGVSVLCESTPMDPEALAAAEALLVELDWQGVAMVEFKVDDRDGRPKLMEINGRFWGSLQLAVDAGVDFPALLLEHWPDAVNAHMPAYRVGVRTRWLLGDVDALLIRLLGRSQPDETSRARAVADFLTCWGRDLHYENPRWSDLGPCWREAAQWVARLAGARAGGS